MVYAFGVNWFKLDPIGPKSSLQAACKNHMGRVFKPVSRGVVSQFWTCEWHVGGKTFRKRAFRDKAASLAMLRKLEDEARARSLGVAPPSGGAVAKLDDLLEAYLAGLAARGREPTYLAGIRHSVEECCRRCRWSILSEVRAEPIEEWLAGLQVSPATRNGHLRNVKAFIRWACEREGVAFPLLRVKPANEQLDRRRSRRILTDAELAKLLSATEAARPRWNATLTPKDRAMLYRMAAYTGLRASELASLTTRSFRLESKPPVVTVEAKDAKGRREETVPIPSHLVEVLRPWLAGKKLGSQVWPGRWASRKGQGRWLELDLRRAGIAERDSGGRKVTFHSFRRVYVTGLIRAGGLIHEVRRLARHRDAKTTLDYYAEADLEALGRLADRLVAPPATE